MIVLAACVDLTPSLLAGILMASNALDQDD